jgi:hypothetical protein
VNLKRISIADRVSGTRKDFDFPYWKDEKHALTRSFCRVEVMANLKRFISGRRPKWKYQEKTHRPHEQRSIQPGNIGQQSRTRRRTAGATNDTPGAAANRPRSNGGKEPRETLSILVARRRPACAAQVGRLVGRAGGAANG